MNSLLHAVQRRLFPNAKLSYAQCGEDMLARMALSALGIRRPVYVDVGANHPTKLSNTYYFYRHGNRGVCVEPNPALAKQFRRARPRDAIIEAAVGLRRGETQLYLHADDTLSTTSLSQAKAAESGTQKIISVPTVTLSDIIEQLDVTPDFVSLDTEGTDEAILANFDFQKYRPAVWCIETLSYDPHGKGQKLEAIFSIMKENGYLVFADTYINTIFIDGRRWAQ